MDDLPSGTVTFLYTDIQGSTRLWERHPELMPDALAAHDNIWREAVAANQGHVYRITGDGFCASFADARAAVVAALAAQQALAAADWGPLEQLKVRAILHTGAAQVRDGDYVGASLNLAGRLLSVCHGGQSLLSQTTADLVRPQLPPGAQLLDLGRHRFRDLGRPVRIFQLSIAGLPDDFPPLSSVDAIPHNLPQQLTSFVGREREKRELGRLLGDQRLVTLVGPGGTGKTRLSIEVAAGNKQAFVDGVWLVQLAAISDPELVGQTVASVLGVPEQAGSSVTEALTAYLRRKELLLVLDNCEHLIAACAGLAGLLLQSCPGLKILASSREGLGVPGEKVYPLHPLSLPAATAAAEEIAAYEAVRLFVERASLVRPDFSLTADNAGAVADICRRLDGIPLALELAAARIKHLSPRQIAARLDQSFRLLTGGSRAALPRQQTLRALIDWSYDLLSEPERVLFRRLSVFHGGWSLEAAEAVCAEGVAEATRLDPFDILDLTGMLVEKSMVEAAAQGEEYRYRLLETMRQYGLEKLKDAGEAAVVRDAHLAYFTQVALAAEAPLLRIEDLALVERLEADHDNLAAALEWASSGDPGPFLNLSAALGPFWSATGYATEGRKWLGQALAAADELPQTAPSAESAPRIVQAYFFYAVLAFVQGTNLAALTALEKALKIARQSGTAEDQIHVLNLMAPNYLGAGRPTEAVAAAQEAVELARQTRNNKILGEALSALGWMLVRSEHDAAAGWQYLEEGIDYSRRAGDESALLMPLLVLAESAVAAGDLEKGWQSMQEGLAVADRTGHKSLQHIFRSKMADIKRLQGDYDEAIPVYREVVAIYRDQGNRGAVARCIELLAFIDIHRGRALPGAEREQALVRAGRLLGAAETIRADAAAAMPPYEQVEYDRELAALRAALDAGILAAAWAAGRAMSLEAAEDYVNAEFL